MKLQQLTPHQNATVVRALYAVVSAGGAIQPVREEVEAIDAIQRHLFLQDTPLPGVAGPLPADLASVLDTPALRLQIVRLMAMLPPLDKQLLIEKVEIVEAAAAQLGVQDYGLILLRQIALKRYKRLMFGLMKRFMNHYWPISGQPEARSWLSLWWSVTPWFPGLGRRLQLDELHAKYLALEKLPQGTLGRSVHAYYAKNGFPIPGSPRSIPEGWARHELYHIISNYGTSLQGEMLLAGFIAGNTAEMGLDVTLPALVQMHMGRQFVPGPVANDMFKPDEFFRAMARGAAMSVDLLAGWQLWEHAHLELDDIRTRYGLPRLSDDEARVLTAQDALLA